MLDWLMRLRLRMLVSHVLRMVLLGPVLMVRVVMRVMAVMLVGAMMMTCIIAIIVSLAIASGMMLGWRLRRMPAQVTI